MNNNLKIFIGFVAGAILGSGATYTFLNNKFIGEIDAKVEEEIKPERDALVKLQRELIEKNRHFKEKEDSISELYTDLTKAYGYATNSNEINNSPVSQNTVEQMPQPDIDKDPDDIIITNAYRITVEEFNNPEKSYRNESIDFYQNGVALDGNFEEIIDFESLLGTELYNSLPELIESGESIIWIRNENMATDFEINLIDFDYDN